MKTYQYNKLQSERSVRILVLEPSRRFDAPLSGHFVDLDLDAKSRDSYEAVSYVWGSLDAVKHITIGCNGGSGEFDFDAHLELWPNAAAALMGLRNHRKRRRLWMDSICIDQNSITEKNIQIPLMADVYKNAKQVLVWLRDEDMEEEKRRQAPSIARFIKLMGSLFRRRFLRLDGVNEEVLRNMSSNTALSWACEKYVKEQSKKYGEMLIEPFLHDYFWRVWTVQELALAKRIVVHYGGTRLNWQDFAVCALLCDRAEGNLFLKHIQPEHEVAALTAYSELRSALRAHFVLPFYNIAALIDTRDRRNIRDRFEGVKIAFAAATLGKGLGASEPRDQAYATLWAFPPTMKDTSPLFKVDYSKSIEVVYTEYTTALWQVTDNPHHLLFWVNSLRRNARLPSWVPDWNDRNPTTYSRWATALVVPFEPNWLSELDCAWSINDNVLSIGAVKHSVIKTVVQMDSDARQRIDRIDFQQWIYHQIYLDMALFLDDLYEAILNSGSNDDIVPNILYELFNLQYNYGDQDCERDYKAGRTEAQQALQLSIHVWELRMRIMRILSPLLKVDDMEVGLEMVREPLSKILPHSTMGAAHEWYEEANTEPTIGPFMAMVFALYPDVDLRLHLRDALSYHRDKNFFVTDDGYMGIAYRGLRVGDQIVLMKGVASPMVVRESKGEKPGTLKYHSPAQIYGFMRDDEWLEERDDFENIDIV